ncbi:MAG: glycoside/pentoside/hexuronide:cation symporter, family, partial [Verrucomicrobiota bacterium]|nr:glycoside/pentoside/hexuronide:cation symporter, family [Verrucomicrobiota bacterium]
PDATWGMVILAITGSNVYAPTCANKGARYADAADSSEWQTGRRFTGMVFATIGFSLKSGLALGSACLLWILAGFWGYETSNPSAPNAIAGFRACSSIVVGLLFLGCVISVAFCGLNKSTTLQMSAELAERRRKAQAGT